MTGSLMKQIFIKWLCEELGRERHKINCLWVDTYKAGRRNKERWMNRKGIERQVLNSDWEWWAITATFLSGVTSELTF